MDIWVYEYLGEITDTFYLSKRFSNDHDLLHQQHLPLPDDYPEWIRSLALTCEKCFLEKLRK